MGTLPQKIEGKCALAMARELVHLAQDANGLARPKHARALVFELAPERRQLPFAEVAVMLHRCECDGSTQRLRRAHDHQQVVNGRISTCKPPPSVNA